MSGWVSLLSVWVGVASLLTALAMLAHRPAMTDATIVAVLYFGSPGALCLAGLALWAHRNDPGDDPATQNQRLQSKVAIALALTAAAIVYALIIFSQKFEPV